MELDVILLVREAMAGVKGSGDKEVDAEVYNKTLEERSNKWLSGPIQWEALPDSWQL